MLLHCILSWFTFVVPSARSLSGFFSGYHVRARFADLIFGYPGLGSRFYFVFWVFIAAHALFSLGVIPHPAVFGRYFL